MEDAVIRINDRQDPQQGSIVVAGNLPASPDARGRRTFVIEQGEFTARLAGAVVRDRFLVALGDPDAAAEGEAPDVWYGVVESWQPAGNAVAVTARPARTIEEAVHS